MADSYWEKQLRGLEPTAFPDLTGRSSLARKDLTNIHSTQQTLRYRGNNSTIALPVACLAASAKILTLYLGETDFCFYCLCQTPTVTDGLKGEVPLPLRLAVKTSDSNKHVLSQVTDNRNNGIKYGPPSQTTLQNVLGASDVVLSDVLVVVGSDSFLDQSLTPAQRQQYGIIVEFVDGDSHLSDPTLMVRIHWRSSNLLHDDTPHVFAALESAFDSVLDHPSSGFLSWTFDSTIQKSVYNPTVEAAACGGPQTVHSLFERHAKERPHDIALDFLQDDHTRIKWTFATLNSIANHIADRLLREFEIQVEESVPICVAKSPAFYACVLGVLKAGAVFTPFAGSPPDRQKLMLDELGSKVMLYTGKEDVSWSSGTSTLDITSILEAGTTSSLPDLVLQPPSVSPSNLCYQMYTSGSTGRPKAVSLEHINAVQTACATRDLVPWTPDSRILQQAGVTFDMCYFETFFAWNIGICLCSAPDNLIYNRLTEVINDMDVALLGLTPSVALTIDPSKVPGIKWMYCIGEALPQSLVNDWEGRLVNAYGPTEAAQMVTLFPVDRNIKSTVIGQPFKNTSFVVLQNTNIDVVPILGVGELCIGGLQVARGYHKNPEKTKQSFIAFQGEKFYRTGDLVRMLGNEQFEFIGRVDDQVKIRGQRVELGEIDKALEKSHSTISRACTQVLKVSDKAKSQLVAFLVLEPSVGDHDRQEILDAVEHHLSSSLPAYMVPKLVLCIDRIPLSLAGKVDKRALTKILRDSDEIKSSAVESKSGSTVSNHQMLQQVYGETCDVPFNEIGLDVSIYQLGIDSISAIQIAHTLKAKGFQVQASDIMNYPTITKLSQFLEQDSRLCQRQDEEHCSDFDYKAFDQQYRSKLVTDHRISGTKIAQIRPASPLQTSMIVLSMQASDALYFNHLTYRLPKEVDIERFLDAWEALISKHEILRSGFVHLTDSQISTCMVTYYARSLSSPVRSVSNQECDLDQQRLQFTRSAVKDMHLPPWQVLVSQERGEFYFSAHHALYDAQVLDILMRDLSIAYDGMCLLPSSSFEPHLAKLLVANTEDRASEEFWIDLGSKTAVSKFPLLNPLFEEQRDIKSASAFSPWSLPDLEKGCRDSGITMQAAAQASWGYLLSALTGEDIVTFGTVLSGRVVDDAQEVAFPMITTVPTIVNSKTNSRDLVSQLMSFNADVQRHQYLSLQKMQKLLGYAGETLFDTIFTFQKRSRKGSETATIFEFLDNHLTIEYPVSVELEPTESQQLQFTLFYQSRYMHKEQAELLVQQYLFLLHKMILGDDQSLTPSIDVADPHMFSITPAEHESLPSSRSLMHHSVEMTAAENPDRVALEFVTSLEASKSEKQSWTYRALDEEGNRVANFLRSTGIAQGSIVAICFDKCPEAAFSMLGISKAGCAFLALDPGSPIERKRFIMQDSQAAILLTKGALATDLKRALVDVVVDLGEENLATYSPRPAELDRAIGTEEMAYCLYTSGTTGTPKGCVITHENVIQVFLCFEKLYMHTDESRWLQFASYHFDVSVMEHFWSWFVGMTVVKAGRDLILQDLSGTIAALQITHIDLTPSLARLVDPRDVPSLAGGVFVTGGEMLRRDIIEAWGESGAIYNAYGPTEATIGVTMYRHVPKAGRPSNIGWPFHVVGVFVVDPSDPTRPVLRGGVGELLVSGKLVAKGYLRRDELTKQRFIWIAGQKCYKTGDLVRILSNGSIEFLGRADDQVKLRGQRLEIGEINSVIKQRDNSIDDVSTLVLKHPKQQKEQLVSFVAVNDLGDQKAELSLCQNKKAIEFVPKLRSACAEKLPGYMIPTHILMINKMPLSANNKIEGKQLKMLYEGVDINVLQSFMSNTENTTGFQANKGDVERISRVLAQSVGVDAAELSPTTSFFELGLDSISMISFSRSLKAAGYKQASPSSIMRNPTISKLVTAISSANSQAEDAHVQKAFQEIAACNHRYRSLAVSALNTTYENVETIVPCTALQAGIISRSLESNQGSYFTAFHFDIHKSVDTEKLRKSCQLVCDHVQVLRTQFLPTDDGYVQVVLHQSDVAWSEHDVENEDQASDILQKAHESWWRANQHNIQRPFELLLVRTKTQTMLTLHIFHALYDGNSLPLIMEAVTNEYYGNQKPEYGPAFSQALPYGPLREAQGAEDFWVNHLFPAGDVSFENLRPLTSTKGQQDTSITHRIQPINGLEDCRRKLNVTHQAMFQACWAVLLQDIMAGPMVLGMIVSGRSFDFEGADKVIGPLFNTIPFMLPVGKEETWRSIITRAHEFNTAALTYQHTPLRDIRRWTRDLRLPDSLFETLFVFQKESRQENDTEPLLTLREETFEADYPLALEVEQTSDGGFHLTLACQAFMSDEDASTSLLQKFERTLRSMIEDVDVRLSEVTENDVVVDNAQHHEKRSSQLNGNGTSNKPHTNGTSTASFSETAKVVRKEIAVLASVDIEDIRPDTSIFELGLDSIDAVKLSSRLKKATGVQVRVSQIMRLLNINKIATAIDEKGPSAQHSNHAYDLLQVSELITRSLEEGDVDISKAEKVLPCTPLQEGMVADMLNSSFERYLNFDVLKLNSDVDVNALKSAWTKVVDALPILRSRFVNVSDPHIDCTIAQVVVQSPTFEFGEIATDADGDFSKVFSDIRQEVKSNFNDRPAFRLTFIRESVEDSPRYLILTLPHAMYDGWSLGIIHDYVHKAYHGDTLTVPAYEPALTNILNSSGKISLEFWHQQLAEAKVTLFPMKQKDSRAVHRLQRSSSVPLTSIQTFCRQFKVTIAALCQMVWSVVLAYHTEQLDVSFAQVLSGRNDEATNDVVFPTMNTVVSRTVVHGKRFEMVQYLQENLGAISEHQHFPLRKALALLSSKNSKAAFNTLFIFQKSAGEESCHDTQLYESVDGASNVEYPVCVEAEVSNDQLIWRTACEETCLNQSETQDLLERLDNVLGAITQYPENDVATFDSGKVQLCNLPSFRFDQQQESASAENTTTQNGPSQESTWSDAENMVRQVLADVAKVETDEILKSTSLFGIGLDSISTIKVSSLLRKKGVKISVNDILSAGSIQEIAKVCDGEFAHTNDNLKQHNHAQDPEEDGKGNTVIEKLNRDLDTNSILTKHGIDLANVEQVLPTTAGQMLLLSRWQNENVYYSSLDFSVSGCKDIAILRSAWHTLVQRTPMMRTIFLATGQKSTPVVQVTLKNVEPQFVEVPPSSDLDHSANSAVESQSRFHPPCILFAQAKGNNHFELALTISHALYDGFSLKMLIASLQDLINNPSSTPTSHDYDYAGYLAGTIPNNSTQQFWSNYLSNARLHPLPSTKAVKNKQNHVVKADVLPSLSPLRLFARNNKVSIQSLLLASYSVTHAIRLREHDSKVETVEDVLIGIFMANRNSDGADELAAPTLGFAPVRVKQPLTRSVIEIARGIQKDLQKISEGGRSQVALWELQGWIGEHIKVDVWVNILRQWLPDASEEQPEGVQVFTGEKSQDLEKQYDVKRSDEDVKRGLFLKDNAVRHCYDYPMMDLEATVKDDNLDIGIQAPSTLLDADEAKWIIRDVAARLNDLATQPPNMNGH